MTKTMLAESQDEELIIARAAALDIGKAELVCCVRVPAEGNRKRRLQEVSTHSTMSRSRRNWRTIWSTCGSNGWSWKRPATTGSRCFTCWKPTDFSRGWSTPAT